MESLRLIDSWPVTNAAAAVVRRDGTVAGMHGPVDRRFGLASVTKLLTAYAALIAVEEGAIELDQPAGPPGATVRHLLAHTSGLGFTDDRILAPPGQRRLYSNTGFERLAETVGQAADIPFPEYLRQAVIEPLAMTSTALLGSPAAGAVATIQDLTRFAAELQAPRLLHPSTLAEATRVAFPDRPGVLPGFGFHRHNDWGLGFEIRDGKDPHWTGKLSSPRTFGHFGQCGTFLWVDPEAGAACVCLTDRDFGPWAAAVWPALTDAVLGDL